MRHASNLLIPAAAAAALALAGCATAGAGGAAPLGTVANPVKVNMPVGERAYLDRLRCPDGSPPRYQRLGSGASGRDGHILDYYTVACPGAEPVTVVMDMYHRDGEDRPVPGFTIVPRGH